MPRCPAPPSRRERTAALLGRSALSPRGIPANCCTGRLLSIFFCATARSRAARRCSCGSSPVVVECGCGGKISMDVDVDVKVKK